MRKFLTRRTIIPLFLAFFVLLFLIFLMFSGRHENHRVNGNEWFLEQRPYFEKLRSFVSTMDEVYTLYISEVMEVDTFKLEHSILTKELQSINDEYYANKAHIKIAPGTFSTDARNGISALEGLGENLSLMLSGSFRGDMPLASATLSYFYIAQGEQIKTLLTDYLYNYKNVQERIEGTND